ncbi:MAG: transposase [Deltaproteobacteria bacterium RBG_16_71_12]|nr:MAG: transposase [Deltaproteobacteria bacterium RBG_16_71_12]
MRRDDRVETAIVTKYTVVAPLLNERARRLWAATESRSLGYGGDALVSAATGLARDTIRSGRREIERGVQATGRVRRPGAGRPGIQKTQPGVKEALERLVDPLTRGDPRSPLRWTCKSRAKLASTLTEDGWRVSSTTVSRLLHELGYSLQSVRKSREGTSHPDRNEQFEHINATAASFLRRKQPVISVDTKKKELVGNFKNAGREWRPKATPEKALVHDFPDDAVGKAIPYGVYDMARNEAWVSVGRDHDTPEFAVASIRQWWKMMGQRAYPNADRLFITADAGGSNGYRARAWKLEVQRFADDTGLRVRVSHFPPGTSKWNKIEHRLFCHITQNWRGKPLRTFETIVDLIGATRTAAGLRVKAKLDSRKYKTGVVITKSQMRDLALRPDAFHGEWNYEAQPRELTK